MQIQVKGINKNNRQYFKTEILKISNIINGVYFADNNAMIDIKEPYFINEDFLIEKCKTKKAIQQFISDFRMYQFNQ